MVLLGLVLLFLLVAIPSPWIRLPDRYVLNEYCLKTMMLVRCRDYSSS
jgi:hypothetical protein